MFFCVGVVKLRPQSPVSEVVFQQTVTVIPPEALHTVPPAAQLSSHIAAKVSTSSQLPQCVLCIYFDSNFNLYTTYTFHINITFVVSRILCNMYIVQPLFSL